MDAVDELLLDLRRHFRIAENLPPRVIGPVN
jgi:hypothetical protein